MLALDVVQAAFGDCLVVRYVTSRTTRTLLIDGGPSGTYPKHLRPWLMGLAPQVKRIDVAVLSHIDNDHVKGLLDLFAELHETAGPMPVGELWHNAFSVSAGGADIAPRIREALATAGDGAMGMKTLAGTLMGVGEGDALRASAVALGVPINARFGGEPILADGSSTLRIDGLRIDVIGPSTVTLEKLRREWVRWLERHGRDVADGGVAAGVAADSSIPNLSSIVLLVRAARRSILLTGDGRGEHVVEGLHERGLLEPGGTFHVDVLKVPHHGSARNASEAFFRTVLADRYVISADGRYGNPDSECLRWIVDAADGRPIEIVSTNQTDALRALVRQRPPKRYGYKVTIASSKADAHTIVLDE